MVLIPLKSGKFLNNIHLVRNNNNRLNPFEVREVSKRMTKAQLESQVGLNPFEVREVSKQVFTKLIFINQ